MLNSTDVSTTATNFFVGNSNTEVYKVLSKEDEIAKQKQIEDYKQKKE